MKQRREHSHWSRDRRAARVERNLRKRTAAGLEGSRQEPLPSVTCPQCGMTSYNANDVAQGYCSNCHEWTTPR